MSKLNRVSTTKDRLALAMRLSGKKQADIASETGLNKSIVSRCVAGKVEPGNKTIFQLARALNVSELWLWGYDVPMERNYEQEEQPVASDGLSDEKREAINAIYEALKNLSLEDLQAIGQVVAAISNRVSPAQPRD